MGEIAFEFNQVAAFGEQLDIQRHAGIVIPHRQAHQFQCSVHPLRGNVLPAGGLEARSQRVEQYHAPAGFQLFFQPVPVRGRTGCVVGFQPYHDAAVLGHLVAVGKSVGEVVVVEMKPQIMDDHLDAAPQWVVDRGLAAARVVNTEHFSLQRLRLYGVCQ